MGLIGNVPPWAKLSSGSGYGSGGYGYGYGDGSGGYGSGSGSGYGYGGYGYGYGDGSGGYGDGSGSGSGYGYGGYGSGDGYGDKALWLTSAVEVAINSIDNFAQRFGDTFLAIWKSNSAGLPCNGGSHLVPAEPGTIHRERGPLQLCSKGTLHATLKPDDWGGDRMWFVALRGEVVRDGNKVGALEREIICELKL